jgi:hypothetical protein
MAIDVASAASDARANIVAMFTGMGSLNDIVLHKDDAALLRENDEFDELRTKLHELTHVSAR